MLVLEAYFRFQPVFCIRTGNLQVKKIVLLYNLGDFYCIFLPDRSSQTFQDSAECPSVANDLGKAFGLSPLSVILGGGFA